MNILVDSNILVRLAHPASAQFQEAVDATRKLRLAKDQLCMVPQNVYEFCSVVTRPLNVNGLGFAFTQAQKELAGMKAIFVFLEETSAVSLSGKNSLPFTRSLARTFTTPKSSPP